MASVSPASVGSQVPYPDPIPGIIPFGTVNILAGASGAGKTTLIANWCRCWSDSQPILGKPVNSPSGVFYLSADRRWNKDHRIWFDKVGVGNIRHYAIADDDSISSSLWAQEKALELFEHCLHQLSPDPGGLLIVDPLTPLFIAGDQNNPRPVARTLLELSHVCERRSLTIIATAYIAKLKANQADRYVRPVDRIAGSGTFAGYSHTQMYIFEPEKKQPYFLFGWKPRHAPEEQFKLQRDAQTGLLVPFLAVRDQKVDRFLALFPKDGLIISFDELADQARDLPMSEATVKRVLQILVDAGEVEKVKRGYYRLALVN